VELDGRALLRANQRDGYALLMKAAADRTFVGTRDDTDG
jgi:hypothetical protein